jgi:hypothetical protein
MAIEILTHKEMARYVTLDNGKIFIASGGNRVASPAFIAAVEWYWYEPHTPRNNRFDIVGMEWVGQQWVVMSFPEGRFPAVRRLAKQLGLRIADGSPIDLGKAPIHVLATSRWTQLGPDLQAVVEFFPGGLLPDHKDNPRIFNIEYDRGNPIYKNRQRDEDAMMAASIEVNDMLNRGIKLTPAEIADYIYGSGPFPNAGA